MGKIYHLKSKKMHQKCIFFISDTDTGVKKYDRYRRVRRCRMLSDLTEERAARQAKGTDIKCRANRRRTSDKDRVSRGTTDERDGRKSRHQMSCQRTENVRATTEDARATTEDGRATTENAMRQFCIYCISRMRQVRMKASRRE